MNEEIQVLYKEKKVLLSDKIIEKIKYLYKKEKDLITNEMDMDEFSWIIEKIISNCKFTIKRHLPEKNNRINYNTDLLYSLVQKFNELIPEEIDYYDLNNIDDSLLSQILNIIYQIKVEERKFYLTCDLIDAKEDCLKNMKYFLDDDTISQFNEEYEKAIQSKDVNKMQQMLDDVQESILKEWEKYIPNMDLMNDDNFLFLGHSTPSTKFDKPFYSRYVSSSLFNQDITDTYKSGYGFILAPKNIVLAKSHDINVNNYSEDADSLLYYSRIKKIDHPQRLIDECLSLKQENIKNGIDKRIYSEVVIDGFEPIGIFCFTDGSKKLNLNYQNAEELQKSFPQLKIYSFDIMKKKKDEELVEMKLSLLNNLQKKFNNYSYSIEKGHLSRFDYFFEEYEKLKQKKQYTEEEIAIIFKNNLNMLNFISPDNLFSGMYNEKQIKYILRKNANYNLDYIFEGKAMASQLNDLKKLYPYRDKLNSIYDGFSEFLELISRIEVTAEIMAEINNNQSINFNIINKILISKIKELINSKEIHSKQILSNYRIKYLELQREIQERTKLQEEYEYYYSIYLKSFSSEMVKKEYKELISDIDITELKERELQVELNKKENDLDKIEERIDLIKNSQYNGYNQEIEDIKKNILELSKHPIINRKRLKVLKQEIMTYEEKNEIEKRKFESLKSDELNTLKVKKSEVQQEIENIKNELKLVLLNKKEFYNQLATIKNKIKNYFKCESIEEIDSVIHKAEEFVNQFDYVNKFYIEKLNTELEELTNKIMQTQNDLNTIQEEKRQL